MAASTPDSGSNRSISWREHNPRSKAPLIFFLLMVLLAMSTTLILLEKNKRARRVAFANGSQQSETLDVRSSAANQTAKDPMKQAEDTLKTAGSVPVMPRRDDPVDLITSIGNALANQDFATAEKLIGERAMNGETRARLKEMVASQQLKLKAPNPVREVGELEINRRSRYALELKDREPGRDRIYFDLVKNNGMWEVDKLVLPPADGEVIPRAMMVDALGVTDSFLLAVLNQNFTLAREFVNREKVSDATLAGLCILFEEGNYRLRPEKPLRAILQKDDLTSFLANVQAADGSQAGQFAIILKKTSLNPNWVIDELNLDQLLSDYAQRFAGGDVYYTPLIKNPAGGDTLVLYFEFDEERLTARTERQLAIVAMILKTDVKRKIHLSGHTDALGSAGYNQELSLQRANAVKDYLIKSGVAAEQIITAAKGFTEPRRPNVKATGEDDPEGRRANRRTEIYLDF
jgi:outer membrane protein OmpA-like peptidoglycan-associated protein